MLAGLSLGLAVIGAILPVMPTVPFLLVSVWAASKGWPALEAKLLAHPHYGPLILKWRDHGAVPRRAKWLATAGMAAGAVWSVVLPLPAWAPFVIIGTLVAVGIYLWTRPEE